MNADTTTIRGSITNTSCHGSLKDSDDYADDYTRDQTIQLGFLRSHTSGKEKNA
jgi:hypothetical protein